VLSVPARVGVPCEVEIPGAVGVVDGLLVPAVPVATGELLAGAELVPLMEVTPQPANATASRRIPLPRYSESRCNDDFVSAGKKISTPLAMSGMS
jgi:hypothetical protein